MAMLHILVFKNVKISPILQYYQRLHFQMYVVQSLFFVIVCAHLLFIQFMHSYYIMYILSSATVCIAICEKKSNFYLQMGVNMLPLHSQTGNDPLQAKIEIFLKKVLQKFGAY